MKVNIICSDGMGWIYGTFIRKFGLYSKHKIFLNAAAGEKCDIQHLLPYYENNKHTKHPFTIWSSHQESKEPLRSKFISAAKQADWCLSPSLKYVEVLKQNGISKVSQVKHGVDLDLFKPSQSIRPKSDKLILGFVGRSYKSTSRKNEQLLHKLAALDFVDLMITGGKVKESDMPEFYNSCHLIISTSLIEGGPMSHVESAACGVPFLCYDDVGTAREINYGTIRVPFKNEDAFLARVKNFWTNKEWLSYVPEQIRAQVETQNWQNFVDGHDNIWQSLLG